MSQPMHNHSLQAKLISQQGHAQHIPCDTAHRQTVWIPITMVMASRKAGKMEKWKNMH